MTLANLKAWEAPGVEPRLQTRGCIFDMAQVAFKKKNLRLALGDFTSPKLCVCTFTWQVGPPRAPQSQPLPSIVVVYWSLLGPL